MKRTTRRRLEVEALESMTLLSAGVAGGAHAGVEALAKKVVIPNPLHLVGTLNGTAKAKASGIEAITLKGKLAPPVGKVSVSGKFSTSTPLNGLAIPTKYGKLLVSLQLQGTGQSLAGTYLINGGTKKLVGETGSGHVQVSFLSPSKFTATFS